MHRPRFLSLSILAGSMIGLLVAGPAGSAANDATSPMSETTGARSPMTVSGGDGCVAYQQGTTDPRFEGEPAGVARVGGGDVSTLPGSAALSPDGKQRIYVMQGNPNEIRISNIDGTNDRRLHSFAGTPYSLGTLERPLWHGDRLAMRVQRTQGSSDRAGRLATIDVNTGTFRVIDADIPVEPTGFDLSADGNKVVYTDASGATRGTDIWVANADGTGRTKIVDDPKPDTALGPYDPPKSIRGLRWSPDGSMIAFSGRDGISSPPGKSPASSELWVVDSNGSDLRQLAADPTTDWSLASPVWSPDGKQLAVLRTRSFAQDGLPVFVRQLAIVDVGSGELTVISGPSDLTVISATRPYWSSTANAIVFNGTQHAPEFSDNLYGVFSVDVSSGARTLVHETPLLQNNQVVLGVFPCNAFPSSSFVGLTPARVLDTRSGLGAPQQPLGAGQTLDLEVLGHGGVPATGVDAVVLNVTATNTTAASFLTVAPTGVPRPDASNLNWDAGKTVPNAVVVKVGTGGSITIFNAFGEADVLGDVVGYFETGPGFTSITPTRLLDTRSGTGAPASPLDPGGEIALQVTGDSIPSSATAVIMNTTVTAPTADSFVTVYPSGSARQETSNLNMRPDLTVANLVASRIGDDGRIRLFNAFGATHLLADAAGYFEAGSGFTGIAPTRVYDSRQHTRLGDGETRSVQVRGDGTGVPLQARAVILNVTVAEPTAASYLTVYPTGVSRPDASNLNYEPGQTVPNLVFAQIGTDGNVSFYNNVGTTELIVDIFGWFA